MANWGLILVEIEENIDGVIIPNQPSKSHAHKAIMEARCDYVAMEAC